MAEQEPAAAVPVVPVTASAAGPAWPELTPEHPLLQFHSRLATILPAAGHSQIWGVTLSSATPPEFSTLLILQKYLRSVSGDVDAAAAALEKTLKWRKEFGLDKPEGVKCEESGSEFDGLGYVTKVKTNEGKDEVVTWNVYGAVKDFKATFGDLDRQLSQMASQLDGRSHRPPPPLHYIHPHPRLFPHLPQPDPHRIAQVHLYEGVSFLRMDPHVKAASKATIELMTAHYPELLSRKFFVGVPLVMSWMFQAVRMFVSAETAKKFVVISYKTNLAGELGEKDGVPVDCGGTGPGLRELQAALGKEDPVRV